MILKMHKVLILDKTRTLLMKVLTGPPEDFGVYKAPYWEIEIDDEVVDELVSRGANMNNPNSIHDVIKAQAEGGE
jgi:hypothetical protein